MTKNVSSTKYFDDIAIGEVIPTLVKKPDELQLFCFSAVTWDTHRTHWDAPFATDVDKLPGILTHGHLQAAFLGQLLSSWAGPQARIVRFAYRNQGMVIPGDTLTCSGKVTEKSETNGIALVTCQVWAENQKGEIPTTGEATLELPLRVV